jgi:hypothetical protein
MPKHDISKAQTARIEQHLARLARLDKTSFMTNAEMVRHLMERGYRPDSREEDRIKPMKYRAFKRATYAEQEAHEERIMAAGKKTVYVMRKDDSSYELSKIQYDYALTLL